MSDQRLTTTELVSTIQGSVDSVHQGMSFIDDLSKNCEDNIEKMNDLLKQNVENMKKMNDLQKQNVENMENIGQLRDDVKSELASVEENLQRLTQIYDEYPTSSAESLSSGSAQSEFKPRVSTTEEFRGNFPTIPIDPEPGLIFSLPAWLDTDSPEARAAIDSTQSPLSPQKLKDFLDRVKLKKSPHSIALRYTRNIPLLICQLREVQHFLENIPPTTPHSDRRLELRLPTLIFNLIRYYQGPGAKEQGPNTMLNYLSPIKSNQVHTSSSLISSSGISSQENLKRKCEEISTSGTPTKSIGFTSTSGIPTKSTRFQ